MSPQPQSIVIEPAQDADIDGIMQIEQRSFASPWRREDFENELDYAHAEIMVARDAMGGEPVAFIDYWVVHDELHILNVATHPSHRQRGLGRALVNHAIAVARDRKVAEVQLEVRRSNRPAISLYLSLGFVQVGERPRYYPDGEDALLMSLVVNPADP